MYSFKVISKNTKSSEHLENKVSELNSSQTGIINFEQPWNSKFIDLTESEWKELNKNGKIVKTNIETKSILIKLKKQIKVYAIYGKEDKIFGKIQLNEMKKIVGKTNFTLINNCSHYLFVDQQEIFLNNLINSLKK